MSKFKDEEIEVYFMGKRIGEYEDIQASLMDIAVEFMRSEYDEVLNGDTYEWYKDDVDSHIRDCITFKYTSEVVDEQSN